MSKAARTYAMLATAVAVLAVVLFLGRGTAGPETVTTRADRIASEIRCPTCQGLSVRASKAAGARAIYAEITRQVGEGEKDEDIRAFLVGRFGTSELLRPKATGIGSVVWIAPVVVGVFGLALLIRVFTRRRRDPHEATTDADRVLVDTALHNASTGHRREQL